MVESKKYKLTKERLLFDLYIAFFQARRHKAYAPYVRQFEEHLHYNLSQLCDVLWDRTYKPLPSICFIIQDPTIREVYAAAFIDRIVHHLYYFYTHEMYEHTFIYDSYSCIDDKGTSFGIERLYKHIRQESLNYTEECFVLKLDITGYFMHINRKKLLKICNRTIIKMSTRKMHKGSPKTWEEHIDIEFVMYLTHEIVLLDPTVNCIELGTEEEKAMVPHTKRLSESPEDCGLPIGNLTSQLFSNVYLNIFDQFMKRILKCIHYGRYVDDSYVVSCDREFLHFVIKQARTFLKEELGLTLNEGKTKILTVTQGVAFLGAFIKPWRIYTANSTLKKMERKFSTLKNCQDSLLIRASVNSYLGLMVHTSSYNIRSDFFEKHDFLLNYGHFASDMSKFILEDKYLQEAV